MREETSSRLNALVDRGAFLDDATYRSMVSLFRNWLAQVEMALEDEGVGPEVAQRVSNRLVYGVPSGADAWVRMADHERCMQIVSQSVPVPPPEMLRGLLRETDLRGADLRETDLRGADLRETVLRGAVLRRAVASARTAWPEGFDPTAAGVVVR